MGDRSEQGGRARPFFRSFEKNSRSYLTKRIGKMGCSPTGAVDQSQIRQPLIKQNVTYWSYWQSIWLFAARQRAACGAGTPSKES